MRFRLVLLLLFVFLFKNTFSQSGPGCSFADFYIEPYPYTYWVLHDSLGNTPDMFYYDETHRSYCLNTGCYTLEMHLNSTVIPPDIGGWKTGHINIFMPDGVEYFAHLDSGNVGEFHFGYQNDCGEPTQIGCMDPQAVNYDTLAVHPFNDECLYGACNDVSAINYFEGPQYVVDNSTCDYCVTSDTKQVLILYDDDAQQDSMFFEISDAAGNIYYSTETRNVSLSTYSNYNICLPPNTCYFANIHVTQTSGNGLLGFFKVYDYSPITMAFTLICYDYLRAAHDTIISFSTNEYCNANPIPGCTDPVAINFNSDLNANADDGTCQYIEGCTDPTASNYDPTATHDNDSCAYCGNNIYGLLYICTYSEGANDKLTLLDGNGNVVYTSPVLGDYQIYYENICLQPGMCYTAVLENIEGVYDWFSGYFWIQTADGVIIHQGLDNQPYLEVQFSATGECGNIQGCTNELANNFNPIAAIDDWTCQFTYGCMDPAAPNYNPEAVFSDGSCALNCASGMELVASFNPGLSAVESVFTILDSLDNVVLMGANLPASVFSDFHACVSTGCYKIIKEDRFGDGWDNGGLLKLHYNGSPETTFTLVNSLYEEEYYGINTTGCGSGQETSCSVTAILVPDSLVSAPGTVQIYFPQDMSNVSSVTWYFGDGNSSIEAYPSYFYNAPGTYHICVNVIYNDGCNASQCVDVLMNADGSYGPGGINQFLNLLQIIDYWPVGINELNESISNFEMFPNPAMDKLNLRFHSFEEARQSKVQIYSADGRLVSCSRMQNAALLQFNISDLAPGYYLLNCTNGSEVVTKNFIKM